MDAELKVGFVYRTRHYKADGTLVSEEVTKNLVPLPGINYILNAAMQGATQSSSWYIGLFSGNYTPTNNVDLATLVSTGVEYTGYNEASRPVFTSPNSTTGTLTNTASLARFTAGTGVTLYGGFVCNNATKGNGSGLAISAVRFASPKVLDATDYVDVEASLTLTSL